MRIVVAGAWPVYKELKGKKSRLFADNRRRRADGFYALKVMKETGGAAEDVTDDEVREGIKLLAEHEGIFAETAGGVTVGVAKKLIASGKIPAKDSVVLCVTGNGLKTLDAVNGHAGQPREIKPSLREFEALLSTEEAALANA